MFDFPLLKLIAISWKVKKSTAALATSNEDVGEIKEEEHAGK